MRALYLCLIYCIHIKRAVVTHDIDRLYAQLQDICVDVRKLKDLYVKYGCSFPWQSTLEDIYDYEDFIGKFLYEIYNRKIIKEQLLKHMKSE